MKLQETGSSLNFNKNVPTERKRKEKVYVNL